MGDLYKVIHMTGILMVFLSLGGAITHAIANSGKEFPWKKSLSITHGIGLFIILLGGFGRLARLGIFWPIPGWVIVKLLIWIILGAALTFILKRPEQARSFWLLTLLLGIFAAILAVFKPF